MTTTLSRSERLERLSFNTAHRKLILASGIGWAFDAMDVGLVSFVVAAIAQDPHFMLTNIERSWILSIGFVGMAIGAWLGGVLADRYGRRTLVTATLALFGIANCGMAAAMSITALLIARFVIGLGLGAELPVASTLVAEFSPRNERGRIVVLLESFWAVGWIVAAAIGAFIIPATGDWGWRIALLLGSLPLVYAIVLRMHVPESVRFLEQKGRFDEAERAVVTFEKARALPWFSAAKNTDNTQDNNAQTDAEQSNQELSDNVQKASGVASDSRTSASHARSIFAPSLRARTIALWVTWWMVNFAYYGAFSWMPSLLSAEFGTLTKSFTYTLIMSLAQLPGYLLAAWLVERVGRNRTLAGMLVASALAALCFSQAHSVAMIITFGILLNAANLGAWGVLYAVTPEIYPTVLRATGAGAAAAVGRIAAIIAPLIVPWCLTISSGSKALVFIVFSCAFVIAGIAAMLLPSMQGKRLA